MTARHDRLTTLFAEAIALAGGERAALLARVRDDDPGLADELAALVSLDARLDAGDGPVRTGGWSPATDETLAGPTGGAAAIAIRGYRVLGVLGAGGMGTVFAAEQITPRRRVAIKVLRARGPAAIARFIAEAEVLARLDHPGVVRVLEAGEADGQPFLVMEHVDGATLDAYVRDAKPPPARRLELFAAACEAVHHAHLHGVIHRDLKPSNMMVGADGHVTVLDFGVARVTDDHGDSPAATRMGELIGTPVYMSPEQARLAPHQVDARSDVYSLGVVLFELIAGELPYPVRERALPEITRVICDEPPRRLGGLARHARGDLEAIAERALGKLPAERYQSAAALADDVRRHLAGRSVSARAAGALEQLRRVARRRPWAVAAVAGAIGAMIVFTAVVTALWLDARAARRTADASRGAAETARDDLAAQNDQLTLAQARATLARDPTAAVALLRLLSPAGIDAGAAWLVLDEARGRGVARAVLRGHGDEVHWVEALPAGGAVSAGYDGRVLVWSPGSQVPREIFRAAAGRVHVARPSPDGARLAIGGDAGALHVVGIDGADAVALAGHVGDVEHLTWSRDGRWLVTADDHGVVELWAAGRAPGRRLDGPHAAIDSLEISTDGRAVVAGDDAGALWTWPLEPGPGASIAIGAEPVLAVWSDGDRAAAIDAAGAAWRGHLRGGAPTVIATGERCKHATFSSDGARALLGGVGGAITLVDGDAIEPLAVEHQQVRAVAISPDARRLAAGGDDGTVEVWDRATGRHATLLGHAQRIRHLAFAPSGDVLWSSDGDGVVRVWDLAAMPPSELDGHRAAIVRLATSRDGRTLASVDADEEVRRWTLADGGGRRLGRAGALVSAIAVTDDAVITGGVDGAVAWWGVRPATHAVHGVVRAIAVSADGARVAVATSAGPIAIFDGGGAPIAVLAGHAGGTEALAFAPAGRLLISGGQDRAIRIWSIGDAAAVPIAELDGPTGDTHLVAFSPRDDRIAAAGNDGQVRSWDVRGGAVDPGSARVLARHAGAVTALAFDPSGRWLVSTGRDHRWSRVALDGASPPATATADVADSLLVLGDGSVRATTAAGGLVAWSPPGAASAQIDHSVRAAAAVDGAEPRVAVGFADGTIVVSPAHARTFEVLRAALAAER